jgi:heme-degrading monooxygenase HmoA
MFARIVSMQLKPNSTSEFRQLFDTKILPTLRSQEGFRDELLFEVAGGPEIVAISLWDSREEAEAYDRATYPDVVKALTKVIERAPVVKTYQLAFSTLHDSGKADFPSQSPNTTPQPGVGG